MVLPSHISKAGDNWFFNEKTKKYIHVDKIEAFCDTYWKYRKDTKKVKSKNFYENKLAENRWFGKE
jgi:hypothetical protein